MHYDPYPTVKDFLFILLMIAISLTLIGGSLYFFLRAVELKLTVECAGIVPAASSVYTPSPSYAALFFLPYTEQVQ